jgi:hypothetical protein
MSTFAVPYVDLLEVHGINYILQEDEPQDGQDMKIWK